MRKIALTLLLAGLSVSAGAQSLPAPCDAYEKAFLVCHENLKKAALVADIRFAAEAESYGDEYLQVFQTFRTYVKRKGDPAKASAWCAKQSAKDYFIDANDDMVHKIGRYSMMTRGLTQMYFPQMQNACRAATQPLRSLPTKD